MASIIRHFDGTPIEGSISSSGVFAALDWERLVLAPIGDPIRSKSRANANKRLRGFPPRDVKRLTEKLGHYSDVQSLNGEDTVTWSVFGCANQECWLNDMLAEVFGSAERPDIWDLARWSRIRHPICGQVENGPESDVVVQTSDWRYVIEAKWTSDISVHKHGQSQIEMRAYQAQLNGIPNERSGVIVVVPRPARYGCAQIETSNFRRYFKPEGDGYTYLQSAKDLNVKAITWERVVDIVAGRGRPNLQTYMDWRLSHISVRARAQV